jgi:hypothetical protein
MRVEHDYEPLTGQEGQGTDMVYSEIQVQHLSGETEQNLEEPQEGLLVLQPKCGSAAF